MKRICIVLILAALAFYMWLILRPKPALKENAHSLLPPPATNVETAPFPNVPAAVVDTNVFIRPNSIDEDHWNRLMLIRQLALSQNQPIEFYARVLDQDGKPIAGAKVFLKLTRTDERMFETTNYFSRKMGDEVLIIPVELMADSNGWLELTKTNGYFLNIWGVKKEGYTSSYPDGNFAGVHFEPGGVRTPTQDIQMTNAWNPKKGYILYLQKY